MRKLIEQPFTSNPQGKVGKSHPHESAIRQVSGQARYVDDMPQPANLQYAAVGTSPEASGTLNSIDLTAVWASPGVTDVITVDDVPGHVDIAPVFDGDPIFAQDRVLFNGQALFAVLADSVQHARQAALKAIIDITPSAPCLTVETAKQQSNFVRPAHFMQQGDFDTAFGRSELNAQGHLSIGGQEHMYLEGQVSMAINDEEDRVLVYTSSQHPSEVQKLIAEVLGCKLHKVVVDMRRMGGGFGGKETQAAQWACIAALLAKRNQCAVRLRLPRMQDMIATGKRHPFENSYQVGFNQEGLIRAADIDINGNCGHSPDLSDAIVDRAMFHCDNGYYLENVNVAGHRCRTNQVSHTAYRGFGGPQGMIVAEAMMDAIARKVGKDPLTVRKLNLYGDKERNLTPYGMTVEHNLLGDLIARLEASSDYWARRKAITQFNNTSPIIKKGLSLTPVKIGIAFTAKHLHQAGALLHVYT
ncbi:molybdopterin cofactor-binding domain-containing protein, partial [Maritalea sp.]|uniref:molybdopterin cofactor-binding domain-containing protein n=1 Tax=Maritalea sp. TaxID=2003361 RepID=UPI003EF7C52D